MIVRVEIHFSFSNNRTRSSDSATNIKGIKRESSANHHSEMHKVDREYSTGIEGSFIRYIKNYLMEFVRRSPSNKKCIFSCDAVPGSKIALRDEFNKKLTATVADLISKEIAFMARRRFKNPKAFI